MLCFSDKSVNISELLQGSDMFISCAVLLMLLLSVY